MRNDRLLMFCLRMNMLGSDGKRLSASYFDPGAERLTGSGASITIPDLSRAEKDDANAAMVEHFDPVQMSLPEIEAMQKMLAETAQRKRAEESGPPEHDLAPAFFPLTSSDWKEAGTLEGLIPAKDALEPWNDGEDDWEGLGGDE